MVQREITFVISRIFFCLKFRNKRNGETKDGVLYEVAKKQEGVRAVFGDHINDFRKYYCAVDYFL